jgi:hypothetical protein
MASVICFPSKGIIFIVHDFDFVLSEKILNIHIISVADYDFYDILFMTYPLASFTKGDEELVSILPRKPHQTFFRLNMVLMMVNLQANFTSTVLAPLEISFYDLIPPSLPFNHLKQFSVVGKQVIICVHGCKKQYPTLQAYCTHKIFLQ